jgi:hypothetical protein
MGWGRIGGEGAAADEDTIEAVLNAQAAVLLLRERVEERRLLEKLARDLSALRRREVEIRQRLVSDACDDRYADAELKETFLRLKQEPDNGHLTPFIAWLRQQQAECRA